MDAAWFKALQKRTGVTTFDLGAAIGRDRTVVSKIINGNQKLTLEQAAAFAELLGVPLADMITRAGIGTPAQAQQVSPGFSESDAAPWKGPDRPNDPGRAIAAALGADRPGIDVWQVKGKSMQLAGLMPGDFMLVDTHAADRARAGDTVVAQLYRPSGRDMTAVTVLRRLEPPVLVAASVDPADARVHVVDGVNVLVRGKVIASWRV
jgi:SOS-response transcriptional repressor LexA